MMAYDRYGRVVPTPRDGELRVPGKAVTVAVCAFVVALFALCVWLGARQDADVTSGPSTSTGRHMTPMDVTFTEDGGRIGAYVICDPDTQVQYVVTDRGGITPRLDRFGRPMGTTTE